MNEFLRVLNDNKQDILDKWFSGTLNTYPSETASFLKNQKDSFSNPVGKITFDTLSRVFENLILGFKNETFTSIIDPIIRTRAVQNFMPSEAIGFIFSLKKIVSLYLYDHKIEHSFQELILFYDSVDTLAMVAFDKYMECKEQIYELKATESRNQFFNSLSRAGLIVET